ncbi:zinc ribbon domain-containing protein [Clostridium estertheticum]|uniref:Transposase n=1 Tax=Clostridium estertheticum TaxID=238834 RepID=A0A7Y3T1V1_9CLOT|nr:zinc ribbon domain-containing protein [Clostridium estertheticum]NNU78592.1 transposase [Clostridium estertheticum]WBL49682.1 transposase [Clostridium estertheticum]
MSKEIKSVFLYGYPAKDKLEELQKLQNIYTKQINIFIEDLAYNKEYYIDILNNKKKYSNIRSYEKLYRNKIIGSAYSQNCIDRAVTELHSHFIKIRNAMYGESINDKTNLMFVSSLALFSQCLLNKTIEDCVALIEKLELVELSNKKIDTYKVEFYKSILNTLKTTDRIILSESMLDVKQCFFDELNSRKIPYVINNTVQLDARLFNIVKSNNNISEPYVIQVKGLKIGHRISVPINTSSNSLRRMNQYKTYSPNIKVINNKIMVLLPFKKKVELSKITEYKGVDVGITTLLSVSDGRLIGSFSEMQTKYDSELLPKLKYRSNLRNLMRKYRKLIKSKDITEDKKGILRLKICHINTMLQKRGTLDGLRRGYNSKTKELVNKAVNEYVKNTSINTLTIVEDINLIINDDIAYKNRKFSNWCRGLLLRKLEETLSWSGKQLAKVDPAYTSQLCPRCSLISKNNRHGKRFKCIGCGHENDADVNAAENIKNRYFNEDIRSICETYEYNRNLRHKAIKEYYKIINNNFNISIVINC